jgi:glycosyltransferase involved in cell wall biosynthesis
MSKVNVFHVVESLGGGVFSYFKNLTSFFDDDSQIQTTIIYSDQRKEINPEEIRAAFPDNTSLIKLAMQSEIDLKRDLKAIKDLTRILNKAKPEILHLHSSKAGAIGRIAKLFLSYDPIIFYTPHGYSFLRQDISSFKSKLYKAIEWMLPKVSQSITIACGDTEYSYAQTLSGALLVRNGINTSTLRKHIAPIKNRPFTIGILGRITFARNPEFINLLAKKIPTLKILWIGDGELRHLLKEPNIEITGWFTNPEEGWKHLNRIDVYLQPSLWEGLPISVLEAMVFEKPILATNIIGNKDIVVHNETGYLFETLEDLQFYIRKLKDESLREKLGLTALKHVESYFNSSLNFSELKSIYLNSLTNRGLRKD